MAPIHGRRRVIAQRTVGPVMILLPAPSFDDHLSFRQAGKALGISTFSPKGPIETFSAAILPGLARGHPTRADALLLQKRGQVLGHQLGPVITPYVPGVPIEHQQAVQAREDPLMRQGTSHCNSHTPPRGLLLHGQAPERLTGTGDIMDNIPTPHGMLPWGGGLEGGAGHHVRARLADGHWEPALTPHAVNPRATKPFRLSSPVLKCAIPALASLRRSNLSPCGRDYPKSYSRWQLSRI